MLKKEILKTIALGLTALLFSGCVSMQPLSNYARSGDTITLSLGGTNFAPSGMIKKENVTVQITDALGQIHTAKLRKLFRVYSDPTSYYATRQKVGGSIEASSGRMQGQWMALIDLIDPVTSTNLPLAVGDASLNITAPEIIAPNNWGHGNITAMPIKILEGEGSPNSLNRATSPYYDMVSALEPEPQVLVRLDETTAGGANITGVEYVFSYIQADFNTLYAPDVVLMTPNQNVQMIKSKSLQDDGTVQIKTIILGNFTSYYYQEMDVSIVWDAGPNYAITDDNWMNSLQLVSSKYIDRDGYTLPGLVPVLTKIR